MQNVAQKNTYVKPPDIQELLEQRHGVKFPDTSSNKVMVLCPWHEDHNPSLSVDREQGLFHCFGCQKSGNAWNLVNEQIVGEYHASKQMLPSVPPLSTRQHLFHPRAPSPDEYGALETLGYHDRADKVDSCGSLVAYRCTACGKMVVFQEHCHDRLCPYCRVARLQVFRKHHEPRFAELGALHTVEVATGWLPEERIKEGRPFLHDKLKKFRLGLTPRPDGVFGFRVEKSPDGRWRVRMLTLFTDEKTALLWGLCIASLGGVVLHTTLAQGNTRAWGRFIEWVSIAYEGLTLATDYELVDRLIKSVRMVNGFGKLKPVTGGRLKGASGKETAPHRRCSYCGAVHPKRLGVVDPSTVTYHDWGAEYHSPGLP